LIFGTLAVFQDALCFFLIVPEIRIGDALFEGLQARTVLLRVKDNSGRGGYAALILRIDVPDLQ